MSVSLGSGAARRDEPQAAKAGTCNDLVVDGVLALPDAPRASASDSHAEAQNAN